MTCGQPGQPSKACVQLPTRERALAIRCRTPFLIKTCPIGKRSCPHCHYLTCRLLDYLTLTPGRLIYLLLSYVSCLWLKILKSIKLLPEAGPAGAATARRRGGAPAARAARASEPQPEARPAGVAGAIRRGGALTAEGTALALLRANPAAVLRPGPQFPSSGGRKRAAAEPSHRSGCGCCSWQLGVCGGRDGRGVRSSFRQSYWLARSASLGESDGQRHGQGRAPIRRSASMGTVTELVQALQRGYLELEGMIYACRHRLCNS
jgi:hypothetical protein